MPTTKVPSYRLHKRSQQAVVTLAGHDFYLGKYGTTESREEYARLVGEWLRLKGKPAPPQLRRAIRPKSITVADAAERYLEWSNSHHAPAERAHVKGMLKIVLKLYLHENAENIGPVALREIRNLMLAKGWSRNYVNEQIGRVRRWYKWLSAEELIKSEVYFALKVVNGLRRGEDGARETARILPVSDEVVAATIAELGDVVADMVRLQQLTGMRPAELCMMRRAILIVPAIGMGLHSAKAQNATSREIRELLPLALAGKKF